ncbi:MAG: hypothetical protein L0323_16100 [Planctomycetes bacterium]|nr:hypothetical protein [Planctomycetota bacterium]
MSTRSPKVRARDHRRKDRRLTILANTIEARFPGVQVVVDPYESWGNSAVRWRVSVLRCRRRDLEEVSRFASQLGVNVFERHLPFVTNTFEDRDTALYLDRRRREARAARMASRLRRGTA